MRWLATLAVVVASAWVSATARAETLAWIQQLGTSDWDGSFGVSADGLGSVYISGRTNGSLGGTNAGGDDAFMAKYDASGMLEWTQQLGTSETDSSLGVSADGLGSVYMSGYTFGSLVGTNAGGRDAYLSKYDESGTLQWTQQLGTSEGDRCYGVSADGLGSIYISGYTGGSLDGTNAGWGDAFISKYDESGTLEWTRQLGTSETDSSLGVSADGLGSVYISGRTRGSLGDTNAGDYDAFISKYDESGTLQWTRQLGTSEADESKGVSADGLGSVYIAGSTEGSLEGTNAGGNCEFCRSDAFISKYDANGTLQWTQQIGTSEADWSQAVSADGLGNVYISGFTRGSLGDTNAGSGDAFVSKYDSSGTLQWTQQVGTFGFESFSGISVDGLGSVYMSGYGYLGGPNAGSYDAFVARITDPLLGDVNLDGEVNGLDVDPFVEVLLSGPYQAEADMNEDQVVNGLDVDPFVAAVVGGVQRIPEPSAVLLCIISLGVVAGWRKWSG